MNAFKLISFEMRVEFDIGETDYHVVWSLDNNMEEEAEKKSEEVIEEGEDGLIPDEEIKEDHIEEETLVESKSYEDEETTKEQTDPTQEDIEKNFCIQESNKKEKVFGQHNDVFRESWGLPPALSENDLDNSSTADEASFVLSVKQTLEANGQKVEEEEVLIPLLEEESEKGLVFTTELKITKGKRNKDHQDNIQGQDDMEVDDKNNKDGENTEHIYGQALDAPDDNEKDWPTKEYDEIFEESTTVNFDDSSEYQTMAFTEEEIPETAIEDHARKFTLQLGAGPRCIKLSRKSSGSSPPVFSKSTEGIEPEEMENFGLAWAEAVSLCLERRMSGGHTPEEVMEGVVGELELDKIIDIVEHFIGRLTLEQIENEDGTLEDEAEDDMF